MELRRFETYVLDSLPTGYDNKSMNTGFSYDIRGVANLFVDLKSKVDYKPEKEVEVKPTVYTIRGFTKFKQVVSIKEPNYQFILDKGKFDLNFPWYKDGKLAEMISYKPIEEGLIVVEDA